MAESYRLEEAQDGFWQITKKREEYVTHGEFNIWWDVIAEPTQWSNWNHREYAKLVALEDEQERLATIERAREWKVRESNE